MSAVTVDASVWVAAQDLSDPFCAPSRSFFSRTVSSRVAVHVPAFARVEVACALARRLRSGEHGERLTRLALNAVGVKEEPTSAAVLAKALSLGTTKLLRGADAIYVATADIVGCLLVSWDSEHIRRAGAVTPNDWLLSHRG